MGSYILENDLHVFGFEVKTFPSGIEDVFNTLMKLLPDGNARSYYGVSYVNNDGKIIYHAVTGETFKGEAQAYPCETSVIKKGEYLTETVNDWRRKLDFIKDVFHEMMKDPRVDHSAKCVEWYKTDDEMLCMVKTKK